MINETKDLHHTKCPKCHQRKLKNWQDLSSDEKFVTERLPMSAEYSKNERKNHLFCVNCWYESALNSTII